MVQKNLVISKIKSKLNKNEKLNHSEIQFLNNIIDLYVELKDRKNINKPLQGYYEL